MNYSELILIISLTNQSGYIEKKNSIIRGYSYDFHEYSFKLNMILCSIYIAL